MKKHMAIIDLGSNTARLIALSYEPNSCYKLEDELREVVRLSEGMGEAKIIRAEASKRGLDTLAAFSSYCKATNISKIHATATSAVRDAVNGASFLAMAKNKYGIELDVISGEKEAYYGSLAIANSLNLHDALILDLGGGSMQLSYLKNRKFKKGQSWPLGAVLTTDRFFNKGKIKKSELKALKAEVKESVEAFLKTLPSGLAFAAIGGTVRNLANIVKKRAAYPIDIVHNYILKLSDLDALTEELAGLTVAERKKVVGLNADRADIIVAGAIVIREIMQIYGQNELIISGQGIREGLFYTYLFPKNGHLVKDLREFSVQNLAKRYHDFPKHNEHVRFLALELFEQLKPLHGYGKFEKEILSYAAVVHDIGMAINYYNHHKRGQFMIMSVALPGFSHREQAMISLLVRFHRKGKPTALGLAKLLKNGDMERVAKLAALLRLAEYLERSKAQRVKGLRCHIDKGYLQIEVLAEDDVSIEIKEGLIHADLLSSAYGLEVEIVLGQ